MSSKWAVTSFDDGPLDLPRIQVSYRFLKNNSGSPSSSPNSSPQNCQLSSANTARIGALERFVDV